MPWKTRQMVFLVSLLVLAGCVAAAPAGTDTGSTSTPPTAEPEAATATDEAGVTARFIVNNRGEEPYNVAIFVVQDSNESTEYVPLAVTLRNGTTRTYTDTGDVQTLTEIQAVAADIEPANGTLATVHRSLPPQSSLRVDVANVPEDAKSLVVVSRTGSADPPIKGFSLAGQICTGSNANIVTFNESASSSASCGNVSDVVYSDSLSRHSVPVNATFR